LVCTSISASAHDESLPLGDGKFSAAPKSGHVMACQTHFPGGGGAHRTGDWIKDGSWTPSGKPQVEGNVLWPNARIKITVEGQERVVRANNLPTHPSGTFPIRPGSKAYAYDRNPNRIAEQAILLKMPVAPRFAKSPECVPMGMIGFATSGVAIFNAFDLGGRDAPAYEIQDKCNGHPEITSQYHYHDWSPCLKAASPDAPVGWMLDGFPILGPYDDKGRTFTNKDLDECHGRTGRVLIDGKWVVTYHYRFTLEFPYTIGCFKGAPIRIARPRPPGPPPGFPPPR
jgi:YHYH protein